MVQSFSNLEKAVFITKIEQFKYVSDRYSRLYFGAEFCERLIPSLAHLKRALSYAKRRKLLFSLVTPYVTDGGFRKLIMLLDWLSRSGGGHEVIINDWGVLRLVNQRYLNLRPVLGRLLTKQKRGPSIITLLQRETRLRFARDPGNAEQQYIVFQKKLPMTANSYYKGSNVSSVPRIHQFLMEQRIHRIEMDNTQQGLSMRLPKKKIAASVYMPFVYISTTFFCPTADCDREERSLLKIKPCKRQCQEYVFKLRHRTMPKAVLLKGNTHFYKNERLAIRRYQKIGVDRIVYTPEIPI